MEALNHQTGQVKNLPTATKRIAGVGVVEQNGRVYFSAYTDEKADKEYIRVMLKPILIAYNIPLDAMPIYVSAVMNAEMTRQRLSDAIEFVNNNLEYKLTPAFLIKFDKADVNRRLYTSAEMYEICQKLMAKYYDMNCSENVYQSTKIYDACRQAYFAKVGDYWCLSEVGMKRRSEVEEIERVSKYDVKCVNVGRVYFQNK